MRVGVLTGTGTYTLPGAGERSLEKVITVHGDVPVTRLELGGVEILHISRHGEGHTRLSNHVAHRANILALKQLGVDAIAAVTVCGAVDPSVPLGSLIVFDDLHFVVNRLADGTVCTLYDEPGDPLRGHWIYERPFADGVRAALLAGAREAGVPARDGGCYGHVDGPRFNTRAEIRSLALAGVTAGSQTPRPQTVLAGGAGNPHRAFGHAPDHADSGQEEGPPPEELPPPHR